MSTVFALFSNPAEAAAALHAAANVELGDGDVHLVGEWAGSNHKQISLHSVSNPVSKFAGQVGPRARPEPDQPSEGAGDLDHFFKKSLERGGQIVAVSLADDSYKDRAISFFEMRNAVAVATLDG